MHRRFTGRKYFDTSFIFQYIGFVVAGGYAGPWFQSDKRPAVGA
jgi:hypothetical protein